MVGKQRGKGGGEREGQIATVEGTRARERDRDTDGALRLQKNAGGRRAGKAVKGTHAPLAEDVLGDEAREVRVVGPVVEAERAAVLEVGPELAGEALAELLGARGHLALQDPLVLLLLRVGLQRGTLGWSVARERVSKGNI